MQVEAQAFYGKVRILIIFAHIALGVLGEQARAVDPLALDAAADLFADARAPAPDFVQRAELGQDVREPEPLPENIVLFQPVGMNQLQQRGEQLEKKHAVPAQRQKDRFEPGENGADLLFDFGRVRHFYGAEDGVLVLGAELDARRGIRFHVFDVDRPVAAHHRAVLQRVHGSAVRAAQTVQVGDDVPDAGHGLHAEGPRRGLAHLAHPVEKRHDVPVFPEHGNHRHAAEVEKIDELAVIFEDFLQHFLHGDRNQLFSPFQDVLLVGQGAGPQQPDRVARGPGVHPELLGLRVQRLARNVALDQPDEELLAHHGKALLIGAPELFDVAPGADFPVELNFDSFERFRQFGGIDRL